MHFCVSTGCPSIKFTHFSRYSLCVLLRVFLTQHFLSYQGFFFTHIYFYFIPPEFFTPLLVRGLSRQSEWQQVFSDLHEFSEYSSGSLLCCDVYGVGSPQNFTSPVFFCFLFFLCVVSLAKIKELRADGKKYKFMVLKSIKQEWNAISPVQFSNCARWAHHLPRRPLHFICSDTTNTEIVHSYMVLIAFVLWHIKHCRLFYTKAILIHTNSSLSTNSV